MRQRPPIVQLTYEDQSLSTLSTLTDKGPLFQRMKKQFLQRQYGQRTRNPSNSSSLVRSKSPQKLRHRYPQPHRTPPESNNNHREDDLSPRSHSPRRHRSSSPLRGRPYSKGGPRPDTSNGSDYSSRRGRRNVTTMKRTKKISSDISSPRMLGLNLIEERKKHSRSHSPQRRTYYMRDTETPLMPKIDHRHHRDDPWKDHHYRGGPVDLDEAYEVDRNSRDRHSDLSSPNNVLRANALHENLSEASSSIFADLDKEEESTIWGDLEDGGKQQQRRSRRRQWGRHESYADNKKLRLPPRSPRRRSDIEVASTGITTVEDRNLFNEDQDGCSICLAFQEMMVGDCISFCHS